MYGMNTSRTAGQFTFSKAEVTTGSIGASGTHGGGDYSHIVGKMGSINDSRMGTQDDQATVNSIPIGDTGEDAEVGGPGLAIPQPSNQGHRANPSQEHALTRANTVVGVAHRTPSQHLGHRSGGRLGGGGSGDLGRTASFDTKHGIAPWSRAPLQPGSTRSQSHVIQSSSHGNLQSLAGAGTGAAGAGRASVRSASTRDG